MGYNGRKNSPDKYMPERQSIEYQVPPPRGLGEPMSGDTRKMADAIDRLPRDACL